MAGGGGGGGGAGGKGSKKGKGKKGAGKKKGKKGAKGGKKGAKDKKGKCGKGSGGPKKCSGCSKKASAGEPIDIASGEVFVPSVVDMALSGPMPFSWERSYDSGSCETDLGLGWGWSHTLAFELERVGKGRLVATDASGESREFTFPADGQDVEVDGWRLWRHGLALWLDPGTGHRHYFVPFEDKFQLAGVVSRTQNTIEFRRDRVGRVVEVIDSAGRQILFARNSEGRIASVTVPDPNTGQAITFAAYTYDGEGNLIGVTDADGNTTGFDYDANHRLLEQRFPSGITFHYRYDELGRCKESWGAYLDGVDPALDPDLPEYLHDGQTRAKGIYHVVIEYDPIGGRTVISATDVQRYDVDDDGNVVRAVGNGGVTSREYDEAGELVAETDRNGATTRFTWDSQGRLLTETDPMGRTVRYVRDTDGNVIEMIDPAGGTIRAWRNPAGVIETIQDQAGGITAYRWDERGLMAEKIDPNGAHTVYGTDAHGNWTEARLPNGAVWKWRYDWWGRMVERVDPLGRSTTYSWTDGGNLRTVRERDGTQYFFTYDSMGNLTESHLPDGSVFRKQWGGLNWLCAEAAPNGDVVRATYDRDGQQVSLTNENGETTRFGYAISGLTEETRANGERHSYRMDAMGRLVGVDKGFGWAEYERDAAGDVIAILHADGEAEAFEYDVRGELVLAKRGPVELRLERDPVGRVTRETVTIAGKAMEVRSFLGVDGRCYKRETSFGHSVGFERDGMGDVVAQVFENGDRLRLERNAFGLVDRQVLPGQGTIETEYDPMLRVTQRAVVPRGAVQQTSAEPIWVGKKLPVGAIHKTFSYSTRGLLVARGGSRGVEHFEYDQRERLLRHTDAAGRESRFRHDAGAGLFEQSVARSYGPGGRLEQRGNVNYVYDEAGFLRSKSRLVEDGRTEETSYEWGARGSLRRVRLHDGRSVEFTYDSLERRVQKQVFASDIDGGQLLSETRYLWDQLRLLHSETVTNAGAQPTLDHRTYLYRDSNVVVPLGEHQYGTATPAQWLYYATDAIGTPEELVRPDGTTAATIQRDPWGAMQFDTGASTAVRLPGQYADDETGLFYNMHRYYDPEIGRYISPDPSGLEGGTAPYAYVGDPFLSADPFGLDEHSVGFDVYDPQGKNVWNGGLKSGGYETDGNPKKYDSKGNVQWKWDAENAKHNYPSKGKDNLMNQGGAHTERKFLHQLDNNPKAKEAIQKGGVAKLKGDYPPCKKCHRKMEEWAKDPKNSGKGSIEYHYPVKQVMKYSANGAEGKTTDAKALKTAHDAGGEASDKEYKKQQDAAKAAPKDWHPSADSPFPMP